MKRLKKGFLIALLVCLAMSQCLIAEAAKTSPKITINKTIYTMKVKKSVKLKVSKNKAAKKKKVVWTSSNKKVATVSSSGKVKAKKQGKTTITAKLKGTKVKVKCKIYVGTPVSRVSLDRSQVTLQEGETHQITAILSPKKPTVGGVTYVSSNSGVAAVDAQGKVTAKTPGNAVITVTSKDGTGKKATMAVTVKKRAVLVTSILLSAPANELYEKETLVLTAKVEPSNATNKALVYSSSDEEIAAVTSAGVVTAKAPGTATITAKATDGSEKSASVTLKVKKLTTEVSVSSTEQVKEALKNEKLQVLKIQGNDGMNIEIPEESCANVSLVVNAPQGHIENNARFKNIEIEAIGQNSFIEHSVGNTINYAAKSGKIEIDKDASASVCIREGAKELDLVNNGSLSGIVLETQAALKISGSSDKRINVTAKAEADNASISTNQNLVVDSQAVLNLDLSEGAEDTAVTVPSDKKLPKVKGLGRVEVKVADTGDLEMVVGDNTGKIYAQEVRLSGLVTVGGDGEDKVLSGAEIYLIPYSAEINVDNIENYLGEESKKAVSGTDGKYLTDKVSIGNYYLYVKQDGYVGVLETLVLTSTNQETYNVEQIVMLEAAGEATGNLSGTLHDSVTNDPVAAGITVKIRKGRNNLSGTPVVMAATTEEGTYEFRDLPVGVYTVQVLDNRTEAEGTYVTTSFSVTVGPGENTVPDKALTMIMKENQVQFVLNWGDEASGASSDLDSHLIGPKASGDGQFHTWFENMDYYDEVEDTGEEIAYADLDVDDTDYEGPETTTIRQRSKGIYDFYIHDYENATKAGTTLLSRSSAVVRVVIGNKQVASFNVPNKEGNLWHVCQFDSETNKVTEINEMSDWTEEELEYIGRDMQKYYQEELQDSIRKITLMLNGFTKEEEKRKVQEMLSAAEATLESGDPDRIKTQNTKLKEWIWECVDQVRICDIAGSGIVWNYYDSEEIYGQNVFLTLEGYTETEPEFTVEVPEGSSYEIKESDSISGGKMIVVTGANSFQCKYYINYEMSTEACGIENVSAIVDGVEQIDDWYIDYEDEETDEYEILDIEGYSAALPANLEIEPKYEEAEVRIEDSDKEGYDGKVVITWLSITRTYYIKYSVSEGACGVKEISAIQDDVDQITYWDWDYVWDEEDEDENGYYVLYIEGDTETLPANLLIEAAYGGAEVSGLKESDRDGYVKMVTITYGSASRTYYIEYNQTDSETEEITLTPEGSDITETPVETELPEEKMEDQESKPESEDGMNAEEQTESHNMPIQ